MSDFTISGQNYKSGKMDAFTQFHVSRRLAPVFTDLQSAFTDGAADWTKGVDAAVGAISKMSDADSEYVLKSCLNVTQRQVGQAWSPVQVQGRMQYQDIDMSVMLQIAWRVLQENLSPFLTGLPGLSSAGTAQV